MPFFFVLWSSERTRGTILYEIINSAVILDNLPCDRPKSGMSSFTVTGLFSNIACSIHILLTAVYAFVSLSLLAMSLVVTRLVRNF